MVFWCFQIKISWNFIFELVKSWFFNHLLVVEDASPPYVDEVSSIHFWKIIKISLNKVIKIIFKKLSGYNIIFK